ncbi:serine/threonine-protein kinase [Actinomadura rupiterrae]|uniref:serine/threonine-protein kinase n=1 Tax=Actinomadura rupiterrae TaxID=559627 RepID=UPI0020A4F407|nr:serine/threonine-protein kinase [Actinomadura rupiterrae]MCP2335079.1 serine/threonine protein kinase [Actinomadura rupiterrae]
MPQETTGERLLARRYRLVTQVGRGGMGTVWQAHDEVLGRDVAVKEVILPHGLTDEERSVQYKRTFREARTAARLGHPGVVTVYDVVEEDGRPWIVMELIHARSLDQVIKQDGALEPKRAADIGRQMLAALHAAHDAGVLHRDVKPSNVLVASGDRAVLTDFGIATAAGDATLTQTGLVMGSPAYIAPERARGRTAGPASDLWSLGVTMYAMVEGRSPFERNEPMAALVAVISEEPDPPSRSGPLTPVIQGLLRKNPDERMGAIEAGRLLDDIVRAPTVDTQRTIAVEYTDEIAAPARTKAAPAAPPEAERTRVTPSVETAPSPDRRPDGAPQLPPLLAGLSARRVLLVVAMVIVIILAVAGIVWGATRGGGDPKPSTTSHPPKAAPPATTPVQTASASSPPPSPSVPAGFHTYKDPRGHYTMLLPDGWKPKSRDDAGDYFGPADGSAKLQIARAEHANSSALKDWEEYEPALKGQYKGYERVNLGPVTSGGPISDPSGRRCADIEWTYEANGGRMHALDRGFVMDGHGYAIAVYASDKDWNRTLAGLRPVFSSFKST